MVHAPAIESNVCIRASEVKLRLSALRLLRLLFLHSLLGGLFRFLGRLRCFLGGLFRSRFLCSFFGSGFLSGSLCGARGLCYPLIGPFGGSSIALFLRSSEEGGWGSRGVSSVGNVDLLVRLSGNLLRVGFHRL